MCIKDGCFFQKRLLPIHNIEPPTEEEIDAIVGFRGQGKDIKESANFKRSQLANTIRKFNVGAKGFVLVYHHASHNVYFEIYGNKVFLVCEDHEPRKRLELEENCS